MLILHYTFVHSIWKKGDEETGPWHKREFGIIYYMPRKREEDRWLEWKERGEKGGGKCNHRINKAVCMQDGGS